MLKKSGMTKKKLKGGAWQTAYFNLVMSGRLDVSKPMLQVMLFEHFFMQESICLVPESVELIEQVTQLNFKNMLTK